MGYKLTIDNEMSVDILNIVWNIFYILIVIIIFYMLFNRILQMSVIKTGVILRSDKKMDS